VPSWTPDRAHFEIAGDQPAMADAAGDEDRNLGGKRRKYFLRQHRSRDRTDMAARFHPFDDQSVNARSDQLPGQRKSGGKADQFGAAPLDPLDRSAGRQPAGQDDMADLMFRADVDQVAQGRMHGDQIDAERPVGALLRLGDFGVEHVGHHCSAGDDAEAAGIGNGGDEVAFGDPAHRTAQDRDLAAEEIGAALHQPLQPVMSDTVGRHDLGRFHGNFARHSESSASSP
jgi:hypothetical protein